MQRLAPILLLLASGLLAGCGGSLLDETVTPEAAKHLRQSIYKEFDLLVKDFDEADRIRDELLEKGIAVKDGPEGTRWHLRQG